MRSTGTEQLFVALLVAVSLFVVAANGAATTVLNERFKLLPDDEADLFGASVGIDGNRVIVGAPTDGFSFRSGAAYLFDARSGDQAEKLVANSIPFIGLGWSVAIADNSVIAGAPRNEKAYLFDATTGLQRKVLVPEGSITLDNFGAAVGISENAAIVTSLGDGSNGAPSGSAYLFDVATGSQLHELLPGIGAANDQFGLSAGIDGNTAIVGAPDDRNEDGVPTGSAYLFEVSTGRQIGKLFPSDGAAYDNFGWSVALNGNTALVGARRDDDSGLMSGAGYLFDTESGEQLAKLVPSDGMAFDEFGWSVAIDDELAVVGAFQSSDNGTHSGSAYVFDTRTGAEVLKLLPSDGMAGDLFGYSVGVDGNRIVVGARNADITGPISGVGYFFVVPEPGTLKLVMCMLTLSITATCRVHRFV